MTKFIKGVAATTVAALLAVGLYVSVGEDQRFYALNDDGDTLAIFEDSLGLAMWSDSVYKEHLYQNGLDTGHIFVSVLLDSSGKMGKIIDYIDPIEWEKNRNNKLEPIEYSNVEHIVRNACLAPRYMEVPRSKKSDVKAKIADTTVSWRVDLNDLADSAGDATINTVFHDKAKMIIKSYEKDLWKTVKDEKDVKKVKDKIVDKFVISTGAASYGSAGDYATRALAYADVANLTGNLTFHQISATTETATASANEALNNYTFTDSSDSPHNGSLGGGYISTLNITDNMGIYNSMEGGTIRIAGLSLFRAATQATGTLGDIHVDGISTSLTVNIENCIVHGDGKSQICVKVADTDATLNMWNVYGINALTDIFKINVAAASDIENITSYASNGTDGVDASGCAAEFRNVLVIGTYSGGAYMSVSSATGTNTASTDATNENADWNSGTGNVSNIIIADELDDLIDLSPSMLHIKSTPVGVCATGGAAPSIAGNTTGIQGNARPHTGSVYSIGADELYNTQTHFYYSVGTETGDLYSGNATANAGSLFLAVDAVDSIGVGDEVAEGSNRYYIRGRLSKGAFLIQNSGANGGTPGATNITFAETAITIARAFNNLVDAEDDADDANYMNTSDLVTNDYVLNIACYADGKEESAVTVNGYTTGVNNYVRFFTPVKPNEVGVSQRHDGKWNEDRFYNCCTAGNNFGVNEQFTRLEGLQIADTSTDGQNYMIQTDNSATQSEIRISDCILYNGGFGDGGNFSRGIYARVDGAFGVTKINNTILHTMDEGSASDYTGIDCASGSRTFIYNVTAYDTRYGIKAAGVTYVENTASLANRSLDFEASGFTGDYNADFDGNAPGASAVSLTQNSYEWYFTGALDFHLDDDSTESAELIDNGNRGTALTMYDIDGERRDAAAADWDIGADEFAGCASYRDTTSIGETQIDTNATDTITVVTVSGDTTFTDTVNRVEVATCTTFIDAVRDSCGGASEVAVYDSLYKYSCPAYVYDSSDVFGSDTTIAAPSVPAAGRSKHLGGFLGGWIDGLLDP